VIIEANIADGIKMFGLKELKSYLKVTETMVECPVRDCVVTVSRQRRSFKRREDFRCPKHGIYISPSTFEYEDMFDNVLWRERTDRDLLERIIGTKRESRIARDNSEDAVTWNVFRFLEKYNLLSLFLSKLVGYPIEDSVPIYWSYSQSERNIWSPLRKAREQFEIKPRSGSEPDVIIGTSTALFLVEAKLTANNNTILKSKNPMVQERYEKGGNEWYRSVVSSGFRTIAVEEKKYELLRFWLLGSWMAHVLNLDFFLVNLVLSESEKDVERMFKKHIKESSNRAFLRVEWESVYRFILDSKLADTEKQRIVEYFKNKTMGYDRNGKIRKVFLTLR
jgi:hypothetical protein